MMILWRRRRFISVCNLGAAIVIGGGCQSIAMNDSARMVNIAPSDSLRSRAGQGQVVTATNPPISPVRTVGFHEITAEEGKKISQAPNTSSPPVTDHLIDLDVALRLAGVENPTINLAREVVNEAQANQLGARSLLLPSVNLGGNYHLHTGVLQSSSGQIRSLTNQTVDLGAGAGAVGAGTVPYPGVRLFAHLGDAVFEPLAARQSVMARRATASATENTILLQVAQAYLELIGAEERVRLIRKSENEVDEIARLTAAYAKTGQGRSGDANRAAATAELLHRQSLDAQGKLAITSARLCRLLSLDPSNRLHSPNGPVDLVQLVPACSDLQTLIEAALVNRPEIFARSAEVRLAQTRQQQEVTRPFLPTLSAGFSSGVFGGGGSQVSSYFGPLQGRTDFDVYAIWTIQNLGFGNRAQIRRTDAVIGQSIADLDLTKNTIRREVAEALADLQATASQIKTSTAELAISEDGFRLESERVKQAAGLLPIEVLDSFHQLLDARLNLLQAVIAYDIAQFRLYVATGSTPIVPFTESVEASIPVQP